MSKVLFRGIDETQLEDKERNALILLQHFSFSQINALKRLMGLGEPGVVGSQTLATFVKFCENYGLDLSSQGISSFKETLSLGNKGNLAGVIGSQTAQAFFQEILQRFRAKSFASLDYKLLSITGAFEGRGFTNLAGNFDGQGLSFGILQWNLGQGTLPPLLLQMYKRDPQHFQEIFSSDTQAFLSILTADRATQLDFAQKINDPRKRVIEPWRNRFLRLGLYPPFQQIQVEFSQTLIKQAKVLARLMGVKTERGLVLLFDILVQNGGIRPSTRQKIFRARQEKEIRLGRLLTEREYLEIIAQYRAQEASPRWRADVLARKLCIIRGQGYVHKRFWNLDKAFGLSDNPWS